MMKIVNCKGKRCNLSLLSSDFLKIYQAEKKIAEKEKKKKVPPIMTKLRNDDVGFPSPKFLQRHWYSVQFIFPRAKRPHRRWRAATTRTCFAFWWLPTATLGIWRRMRCAATTPSTPLKRFAPSPSVSKWTSFSLVATSSTKTSRRGQR